MKCLQFHSSFPSFHYAHHIQHNQQLYTHKFLRPSTKTKLAKLVSTRAINTATTTPFFLAADTFPAKSPADISVLLQTGGLLLFVYAIANFVVPAFISKQFESDKETEESVPEEEDDDDDFFGDENANIQRKKLGFQGTRTR